MQVSRCLSGIFVKIDSFFKSFAGWPRRSVTHATSSRS